MNSEGFRKDISNLLKYITDLRIGEDFTRKSMIWKGFGRPFAIQKYRIYTSDRILQTKIRKILDGHLQFIEIQRIYELEGILQKKTMDGNGFRKDVIIPLKYEGFMNWRGFRKRDQ